MDIFALLETYFLQFGYFIVFFGAFFESIVIVGFFFPGTIMVLVGGFFAKQGNLSLPYIVLLATMGMFLGDIVNYWLARGAFSKIIVRSRIYAYFEGKEKTKSFFKKYHGFSIFYSHIISYARGIICFTSGLTHYPFKKFTYIVFSGSFIWSLIYGLSGYYFAEATTSVKVIGGKIMLIALCIVIVLIISKVSQRIIVNYLKNRNEKRNY